jgi:hypothetical protein
VTIDHIILLKFEKTTTTKRMHDIIERFKSLRHHLSGIVDIQGGINFSNRNQGYQLVLTIRFENQAALEAYESNLEHQACSAFIRESGRMDGIVVDFVI